MSKIRSAIDAMIPWYGAGARFRLLLRLREFCRIHNLLLLGKCVKAHLQYKYGCELSVGASISPKASFMHTVGVVIGDGAVVSEGVIIYSGVVLGRKNIDQNSYPTIGRNAVLCTGATILGDVQVGEEAVIGAKALVLEDVRPGETIVGIPGEPIKRSK